MQFNSVAFLAFLVLVLGLHRLPLSWRVRKFNLIWLSYLFYAAWNPPFVILLWISTVADWYVGHWLHRSEGKWRRRWLLILSLIVNLGMLSYFKYGGFLLENFSALVRLTGFDWEPAAPSIVLPIGISFYTFQTLSYTLDIFNRRLKPGKSFLDYALFVTFFPQLVAGPIVRAREFLPQCKAPQVVTGTQFGWGLYLFVLGLFEKVVIADGILAPGVEQVYDSGAVPGMLDAWVASAAFSGQIYCDFSGYSLCAIGVAKCLGFQLPTNFRFPLAAVGFQTFWRRWHISLSSWLMDYVYRSMREMSKDRAKILPWIFNILVTWGLVGLWHGASWNFVLWGLASGMFLILERMVRSVTPPSPIWTTYPVQLGFAMLQFAGTISCATIFRGGSLDRIGAVLGSMYRVVGRDAARMLSDHAVLVMASTVAALFFSNWFMRDSNLERLAEKTPWPLRALALGVMIVAILVFHGSDRAFIYFQF